jgi:spore coat polysaccharide biosynthesis protein SpsF
MSKIGIIIQARTGSTRLPSKVVLPFYKENTVLDILLAKIRKHFSYPVVVATSLNPQDDIIQNICESNHVECFRGDELNVLKRFVDCADRFEFTTLVRICADNPFLDMAFMQELIDAHLTTIADYTSFFTSELVPVIKTHYAVFCELVELKALKEVMNITSEQLYLEHVTNYIYTHPELFKLHLLPMPLFLEHTKVRLTLDGIEDWDILTDLYANCVSRDPDFKTATVIDLLKNDEQKLKIMQQQIEKYSK